MSANQTRRLVIAPHMDDETFGCGGLLARFPRESAVVVAAAGSETRSQEHKEAMRILGVTNYTCFGLPDGSVRIQEATLTDLLDGYMSQARPQEVYLPYPSAHQDHMAVYDAGIRACRLSMHADHWYPDGVYVYDVNAYDIDLSPREHVWNTFVELSAEEVEQKVAAAAAYASESPAMPHPVHSIRETAASIGSMRRVTFAEQYSLVRKVIH